MSDTPKMIRETLCVAQTAVGLLPDDYQAGRTRDEHIAQLQRLHDATVDVPESREQCGCANLALSSASTGQLELAREGFPGMDPAEFVERFFLVAQGMKTDGVVTRIEWRYLDEVAP